MIPAVEKIVFNIMIQTTIPLNQLSLIVGKYNKYTIMLIGLFNFLRTSSEVDFLNLL